MHPFYRELELHKPISDFFKNQGYTVLSEIRIGYCRADIVAFKDKTVIAAELKLSDWKKAFIQAKNYQLGADYVYLVFPLTKIATLMRKSEHKLKEEGIGLLSVNEKTCYVSTVINAKPSKRKFASLSLATIQRRNNVKKSKYK
jgi:hypothetical protein